MYSSFLQAPAGSAAPDALAAAPAALAAAPAALAAAPAALAAALVAFAAEFVAFTAAACAAPVAPAHSIAPTEEFCFLFYLEGEEENHIQSWVHKESEIHCQMYYMRMGCQRFAL